MIIISPEIGKAYPMTARPVPSEFLEPGITSCARLEAQCACRRAAHNELSSSSDRETAVSGGLWR